jgi:hypothetical protein
LFDAANIHSQGLHALLFLATEQRLLILALLSSLSFAQTQAPAGASGKSSTSPNAAPDAFPMDKPVLIIRGVCDPSVPKGSKTECATTLTRTQFETLWKTFNRQNAGPVVEQPAAAQDRRGPVRIRRDHQQTSLADQTATRLGAAERHTPERAAEDVGQALRGLSGAYPSAKCMEPKRISAARPSD